MQAPRSFLWHDYETFGTDPFTDRPAQFAAIRTDSELNAIGEPIDWFCAPSPDTLPHPYACLVTGITPQQAQRDGICEAEFAGRVHGEMSEPGTCIAGYNNLRFDDPFTRNLFYRNFFDPYAHEYDQGNTRWDLIDLVRMCYALRPEGVEWPARDDGSPSFRLEDLTRANRISHADAHDALSDVRATIELARRVRRAQPRLFEWGLSLRDQKTVSGLLDPIHPKPVLHTTARIAASRGCTSLVMPLAVHPHYRKSVIVIDLMTDPEPLLQETAEQLHDRVFTPKDDLPEGIERLPLKEIKTNGVPMVAPATTLRGVDCERIGLDTDRCLDHARRIEGALDQLRPKVMDIYSVPPQEEATDPDLQIYSGGFFSRHDRQLMSKLRATPPEGLAESNWAFRDARLPEMLFRYRARNYPHTLSNTEAQRWEAWRTERLHRPPDNRQFSADQFWRELDQARAEHGEQAHAQVILDQLESWALGLGLQHQG